MTLRPASFLLSFCATALCAGAAHAGPPFLTDDPAPTPYHQFEIYAFAAATDAVDDSGASGIDFNYGAAEDLQVTAVFPVEFERPAHGRTNSGAGNIELAAKYRILHQETAGVDVAIFPRLFLPSLSHLGDDHASLLLPVWVGRSGDHWSTFGGGGCALNHGHQSRNYCLAGWVVTRNVTDTLQVGAEIFHQTPDAPGQPSSTILGVGTTYDVNEHLHLLGYAGAGLSHTSETGRGTYYASLLFTF